MIKDSKYGIKNRSATWGITFFSCIYLAYIEAAYTLTTNSQVLFVFFYFICVLAMIDLFYQNRITSKVKKTTKLVLIMISISFTLLLVSQFHSFLFPVFYENINILISPLPEKNQLSQGNEVWIDRITLNEKEVILSKLSLNENWKYSNKMGMIYHDGSTSDNLGLEFKNVQHLNIHFNKQSWSGMVEIKDSLEKTEKLDLYQKEAVPYVYSVDGVVKRLPNVLLALLAASGYLFWAKCSYTLMLTVVYWFRKNEVNNNDAE